MDGAGSGVLGAIERHKIIAILRNVDAQKVLPVAQALYQGGIRLLEITFNQREESTFAATAKAIEQVAATFNDELLVGAGTVMTAQQCRMAVESGARYVLAPNTDASVITTACELGIAAIPGALTPTEIGQAYALGATVVKLFPAATLGLGYIKAIRAPISHIPLIAVGGVGADNLNAFLAAGVIGAGIGANIANDEMIRNEDYAGLTQLAAQYTAKIQ